MSARAQQRLSPRLLRGVPLTCVATTMNELLLARVSGLSGLPALPRMPLQFHPGPARRLSGPEEGRRFWLRDRQRVRVGRRSTR